MIIERAAFEAWVNSHHPYDDIGRPCSAGACPIATYLNEINDKPDTYFRVMAQSIIRFPLGYSNTEPEEHFEVPPWVTLFIRKVDGFDAQAITASRAMSILSLIS